MGNFCICESPPSFARYCMVILLGNFIHIEELHFQAFVKIVKMKLRSILFYFTCLGRMPPVSTSIPIPHSEAKYPAQYNQDNSSHSYRSPASSTGRPLTSSPDRRLTSSSITMESSLTMSSGMGYHKHTSPQAKAIDPVEANVLWLQKSLMQEMAYLKVG